MAAKQIIVLQESTNGQQVSYQVAFWYPITTNPQPQTSGSAWVAQGVSQGPSAAETQAIQAGTIKEEVQGVTFPVGTPATAIQQYLQAMWTQRNNEIGRQGAEQYYGVYFDGTQWAQG